MIMARGKRPATLAGEAPGSLAYVVRDDRDGERHAEFPVILACRRAFPAAHGAVVS